LGAVPAQDVLAAAIGLSWIAPEPETGFLVPTFKALVRYLPDAASTNKMTAHKT
jgi:hypothetical protein